MAILWDGAGGLFTDIGTMIGTSNGIEVYAEMQLVAIQSVTYSEFGNKEHLRVVDGLKTQVKTYLDSSLEMRRRLYEMIKLRITDDELIIKELGLPDDNLTNCLLRLREQMVADAETVLKNTVTLGASTAGPTNTGNGTLVTTKVLDGYNKPGAYFEADKKYAGLDSELSAESETLVVECVSDSQDGGKTEGGEYFKIYGNPLNPEDANPTPYFGSGRQGSGVSSDSGLVGGSGINLLSNGSMDVWSADTTPLLSGWTYGAGVVAGTHVSKETVNIYRASGASVKMTGDGALGTIELSQSVSIANLRPLRRYLVTIRYKASAVPAAGTLGVEFSGTGYVVGSDKISIAAGALATTWTLAQFQINLPAFIPPDWKLLLKVTGTLSAGVSIYVDDVIWQPMTYFGGVGMAIVPGSTPFMKRDRISFTVANNNDGQIQTYMGRAFGVQLPSAAAGGNTIDDALADTDPSLSTYTPMP